VLLTEILLVRFHKLPFTCTYPPFQHSAVVRVITYAIGFLIFAGMTPDLESEALVNPMVGLVFLAVGVGAWGLVRHLRQGVVEIDHQLIFEDIPASGFEFLHLGDGG